MFVRKMLNGPQLPPARGAATHLVVLCHGYGADGHDLIGLAPIWQRLMPTAAFTAPNAPERCAGSPTGYQWFPISQLDPHAMNRGVESAAAGLEAFLEAELARHNLPPDRLALVGFSQGTMMSLHVGLRRKVKPAAIVGYSGMLTSTEGLGDGRPAPPIILVHGGADQMIPVQFLFASAAALGRAGLTVQWHVSPQVGHSIDEVGLALGGAFLSMAFRGLLDCTPGEICCSVG